MAKIELLPKNVYNQISAGEVVEKPASIIKELVENSIDAHAKNITIEIKNGGTEYISVADDGIGIDANDVELAFMPHATSKIRTFEDLSTLNSMGFRGEALASISSVSRVEMTTKTENQELGIKVKLEGGDFVSKTEVASVTGTKIVVKDLFFNTPARAKFLRKNKTEEGDITTYVEKLMLSNTDVNFKYIVDGEQKYNTTNCNLLDVIYTIYGKDIAKNVLEVNYTSGNYNIYGYISKPTIAKNNRTYQSLFVNKRFCTNSIISAAISKSYEEFLMKGKFPLYVLSLSMPQDSLDVNVHPNKLEVKFENSNKIFMLFTEAVSKTLYSDTHLRMVEDEQQPQQEDFNTVENISLPKLDKFEGVSFSDVKNTTLEEKSFPAINEVAKTNIFCDLSLKEDKNETSFQSFENQVVNNSKGFEFRNTTPQVVEISTTPIKKEENKQMDFCSQQQIDDAYKNLFNESRTIIGVAFKTYIIVEEGEKLYFIDQHAAHERQLFDKYQNQIKENDVLKQDLMIPYVLNVSQTEYSFLNDNLNLLNEYGFEIVDFGENCFKITAVPLLLADINIKDYFDDILKNLSAIAKKPIELIRDDIATMACKAAVKAGNTLSNTEINILLDTLEKEKTTLLCPHGRPIIIVYDKKQLEKMFKRIV